MWISKTSVLLCCVLTALAIDEHRPKKKDDRGKRNLQYSISHHYAGPHSYRLERRISTGPQIPLYHSQYLPGPRSYSPYHKGRPHSLPPPPYAVQMEPLVHYSQRDPLYETNVLSLNTDGQNEDLIPDNNHLTEHVYGPPKQQIIERPVYIKEPEPIIEIIIKESNVTLPPPPAPPAPPPKKKEQVQVFYVKYKKNPNGHGKDSVIYDKPIPAISPPIEDEHEEPPPQAYHHQEVATAPPPPSTTLRTIIKPDSETYHSPSGIKVTFGKEGFDYDKRSSKPEDLKASGDDQQRSVQFPRGRQLSSFPSFPRRPSNFNLSPQGTSFRQPQSYRPFTQFRQNPQNFPPSPQTYSTLPKELIQPQQTKSSQRFPPPRPVPPQFQRQPVPYQPFESLRQQQPTIQFRPQTHFAITQTPPVNHKPSIFDQFPQRGSEILRQQPVKTQQKTQYQQKPAPPQYQQSQFQYKPQFPQEQQQPQFAQHQQPQFPQHQQPQFHQVKPQQPQFIQPKPQFPQAAHQQAQFPQTEPQFPQHQQAQFPQATPQFQEPHFHQQLPQYQQPQFQQQQSLIPPGGELIQSLPRFEQHISVVEPTKTPPQPQPQAQPQVSQHQQQLSSADYNEKLHQQLREANALQESIRQQQFYNFQQSQQIFGPTTAKPTTTTATTTTYKSTTQEPEKPSTTTKDPKTLNAQLPDEVPDDLRQQLLSSGILNNADISVLDYDKVGDIPLSALPPDQLANFYSAGGAQQIASAGSAPIPAAVDREGTAVDYEPEASEIREVRAKPEVQMKVVHYDPKTDRGQRVQESYVKNDATRVEPVVLNDERYNRYLPLKVSGTQFPIPEVPELKGKKISSVVVLAPVTYDFSSARKTRDAKNEEVELIQKEVLKDLLKNPSRDNFNKFLESEKQTKSEQQSVILLVTGPTESSEEKEIYMYDVASQTVSKLNGELSSAFVEAAEANSSEETKASASNIVETRVPYVPVIDPESDLETEASEHLESFVDVSGVAAEDDLTASETKTGRLPLGKYR